MYSEQYRQVMYAVKKNTSAMGAMRGAVTP